MVRPVHAHRCVAHLIAILLSALCSAPSLLAEEPPPTKTVSTATLSLRDALFDELAADAERFQRAATDARPGQMGPFRRPGSRPEGAVTLHLIRRG